MIFLFFTLGDLVAAFEMQKIRTGKSRESKTWPAFPSCPAAFISNTSNLWVRNTSRFFSLQKKWKKIVREKFTNYYKMLRIVLCFKNAKLSFIFCKTLPWLWKFFLKCIQCALQWDNIGNQTSLDDLHRKLAAISHLGEIIKHLKCIFSTLTKVD